MSGGRMADVWRTYRGCMDGVKLPVTWRFLAGNVRPSPSACLAMDCLVTRGLTGDLGVFMPSTRR